MRFPKFPPRLTNGRQSKKLKAQDSGDWRPEGFVAFAPWGKVRAVFLGSLIFFREWVIIINHL